MEESGYLCVREREFDAIVSHTKTVKNTPQTWKIPGKVLEFYPDQKGRILVLNLPKFIFKVLKGFNFNLMVEVLFYKKSFDASRNCGRFSFSRRPTQRVACRKGSLLSLF